MYSIVFVTTRKMRLLFLFTVICYFGIFCAWLGYKAGKRVAYTDLSQQAYTLIKIHEEHHD